MMRHLDGTAKLFSHCFHHKTPSSVPDNKVDRIRSVSHPPPVMPSFLFTSTLLILLLLSLSPVLWSLSCSSQEAVTLEFACVHPADDLLRARVQYCRAQLFYMRYCGPMNVSTYQRDVLGTSKGSNNNFHSQASQMSRFIT